MTAYRVTGTIELNGIKADGVDLTINVVQTKGKTGGIGSFALPPGLAGQAFDGSETASVTMDSGEQFFIVITRFDIQSGVAICKTQGALPFLKRRVRWG